MAQPTTAKAGKMRVMLGTPTGTDPAAITVTSLSSANPAVCTVGASDITKFQNGMIVLIAGATGTGLVNANGYKTIASVNTPANTFTLVGTNTLGGVAQTTGVTADPPKIVTYAAPCGFTTKALTLTKNLTEVNIPDCDNPDAVAWIGRDAASLTGQVTGEGVAAAESVPTWQAAFNSTSSVPTRIEIDFPTGLLTYEGYMQCESLAYSAEQGGRVALNVSLQSDGALVDTWATHAYVAP
jgi:predicted secreted protein